ncbi:sensor domain-containing phosphodiesterase [Roseomonas populi]|uniref:EAL domain-containing protein n=1 Tax=Roseomonas populi TaxID=3121582 RepID=A0ABT1X7Y8_9PROT|nr:EAL domain-containing protein [Roseomonas pecuniae]MCR0984220.1 EAL domain-containing protein [Roseomonas pecuniae]
MRSLQDGIGTRSSAITHEEEEAIASAIEAALRQGTIRPAFQPIVHFKTGAIACFEVLARWTDETFGPMPPARFVPIAERHGLAANLARHLIRTACLSALDWGGSFRLAFNISPLHFQDRAMPSLFEESVQATGFPLERTKIEITETAVIGDIEAARVAADLLRGKGVKIALDDFGTGHSSLTRLRALPFDEIKLDGSFVRTMEESEESRQIVGAVISLGRSLGAPVVAEGVETEQQAEALARLDCDYAQGWLFGRPVPAAEAPAMLHARGAMSFTPTPRYPSGEQRLSQMEAIYAAAPIALVFVDRALRVGVANRRFSALMGLDARALAGRSLGEIDPAAMAQVHADLERARRGEPIPPRIWFLPAGRNAALCHTAPARDEAGELLGLSLAVTELPNQG